VHSTTNTLARILQLEDEYIHRISAVEWDDENRWRCIEIRRAVESLWPKRRAELVFHVHGSPRIVSVPDERARRNLTAHGIAPLPSGGD